MAYLLGAAAVMESLQRDVRDIQSCVTDVTSRAGPVHCTSWKFPDKSATDLDIEDLLDLYSYSDEDEERQVAHIALYELVIDRLVLLIHTMAAYTEGILKTARVEEDGVHVTGTSVGVVVKKYWTRLSQLQNVVKQTMSEKNSLNRKVTEMESDISRLNAELKQSYTSSRPKTAGFGGLIPPNRAEMTTGLSLNPAQLKQFGLISKDEYNKSCQTSETAFTPCDSCSIVQKSFRQSGELIVSICQQQQIPSCLQKFRPQVSHLDWLSGNDVSRWSAEQNKDLQRISKLTATIKPLKDELAEVVKIKDKMENRVLNFDRDLKKEKDERSALHKQYEIKISQMELQHTKTLELEKQQIDLLEMNKQELQKLLEKHKCELQQQQQLLKDLENTKCKLEGELSSTKVDTAEVSRLEQEMSALHTQLDDVSSKMDVSTKQLQKEQAKNKSASKHSQSLQSKQASLLQRVDTLDKENKELREQLSELEEEKDNFEESVNDVKRGTSVLEKKLKDKESEIEQVLADKESLEQTIGTLETSIHTLNDKLEEARERERLIVEYPDINGPVNPDISGTGDIVVDMENQVKANTIRIQLLEAQNEGLRNSITKLMAVQHKQQSPEEPRWQQSPQETHWATHVQTKPQPLWDPASLHNADHDGHAYREPEYSHMEYKYNKSDVDKQNHQNKSKFQNNTSSKPKNKTGIQNYEFDSSSVKHNQSSPGKDRPPFGHRPLTGTNSKKTTDEFVVGKVMRPESAKIKRENTASSGRSRPTSGKTFMTPMNTSSIGAYLQLKKAGKLQGHSTSGATSTGSRPVSGKMHIPTSSDVDSVGDYTKQDNYMCQHCDKMYTRQRDLEIHKSYCTG